MTTTQPFDSSKSPLETQCTRPSSHLGTLKTPTNNLIDPLAAGLIGTALALLDQCLTLFSSSLTSDAQLSFESLLMPGATIGKHLRHILDHYRLLLDVLEADGRTVLNYDKRVRLTLIETSRTEAGEAVRSLQRRLRALDEKGGEWLGRKVTLDAVTPEEVRLESTAGREVRPPAFSFHPNAREAKADYFSPLCVSALVRLLTRGAPSSTSSDHRRRRGCAFLPFLFFTSLENSLSDQSYSSSFSRTSTCRPTLVLRRVR